MPEFSTWELLQDEQERFEEVAAFRLGVNPLALKKLRVDDGYGDRLYLAIAWHFWLVAVGLIPPQADRPGNEHAIVDSHGQPLPKD